MSAYELTLRFRAFDDLAANRIVQAVERGLNDAGAQVEDASLEPVRENATFPFKRVQTVATPLDGEDEPNGAGYGRSE